MISQRKGLFNTSGAGQGFWRFRLGKRKAFARAKRATARRAIPTLTLLEQRHLLSFTPTWIGQNGSDFVGTVARSPNDYQDVVIHLSDLKTTVSEIYVQRYGGGAWDYKPSSSTSAFFQASGDPKQGDLYLEPYFNDPTNYCYELTRVFYVDGSKEDYTTLHSTTSVDANLRVHGRELSADWLGQDGNDWTGNGPSVGPNGIQDFHLKVSNISTGGTVSSLVLTANPGPSAQSWQIGTNPQGYSNAELLNRVTSGGTDTADYFGNPSSSLSNGAPLTLQLTYSDQNRGGKTDTVPISAGLTVGNIGPTLAMPLTSVTNFAAATAHSTAQDAGYPGFSHIVLDTPLPNPETTATVQAAVLSDQAGTTWVYGSTTPYTGASPLSMSYDPNSGTFSYPPVRDESSATLTLRLLFTDGAQAVAQVAGATSDPRRRDQPVGTSSENVGTAALLMDAVNRQIANIHLAAGTYLMSAPLNLNYPVKITADPGASVVFSPSPSNPSWTNASGAIGVWASHVSLDGFAISFQGDSASWAYTGSTTRAVIQSAGNGNGGKVDLSFTNLNIQAPAAHTAGEEAVHLMNFDSSDSGQIVGNTLKGGTISLWNGPWQICNNDYQGAPANSISCSVFFIRNEHDVLIQGNHIHSVTPAGATYRFLLFGACDTGRGFNDVIQNNTVDGGIGRPATDNSNNPEIILTEQCQPRFEGTPSSVSPDGYVLQVPYMRGPTAMTGDVVAILSGSQAGQWRLIAQALSPTEYLLDSPLPTTGDYTIAIGRGWVHDTYQDNTIDLRGTNPGNVALDLTGDHFGTRVLNNTFLGSNAISIAATPTEGAFSGTNPPDWGWTHLPIFGVAIDGNTFQDAGLSLNVNHSRYVKSNRGRVYFTGSFTNNAITWSTGPQPAAIVGIPAQNGEPAYTSQNFPWLDDGELVLNLQGNWGVRSDGVVAATIQVIAGTIWDSSASQGAMENKSLPLPKSPPNGPTLTATAAAAAEEIDLSWSVLAGATGYMVERSPDSLNWTQTAAVGATMTSLQDTGLASSATYSYRVRASTAGGDSPYSNTANAATQPMPGLVDFTAETGGIIMARGENLPSEGRANAFDNNINTKWLDFSGTSWIQYQFANNAACVITQYTITSANDTATYPGRAPKSWVLEGSNDGSSWTSLDIRTNQADTANFDTRTYDFSNTTAYKIYRLDSIVSNGAPIIQIAEIKWLGPNAPALTDRSTNTGGTVLKSGEYTPDGTLASNAFDGNPQTKWMWVQVPSWIGYQFANGNRYVITHYSITSANDLPTRDPKDWTFEASNDGSTWTVLDFQTNQNFDQRFQVRDFPINNGNGTGTAYAYYRLNISATHNDPFVQLDDLKLLGPAQ